MKVLVVLGAALLALVSCKESTQSIKPKIKNPLTIERINGSPSLHGVTPRGVKFSPDDKRLTYLKAKQEDKKILELWEFNLETQKHSLLVDSHDLIGKDAEKLSEEEKARRERQRISSFGIVEYFWSEQGDQLLFPLAGDLYVLSLKTRKPKRLTQTKEFELDVRFSPRGNYVSFVRGQDVYAVDIKSGKEKRLTFGGKGTLKNGMAEFVAQEEMGRDTGYWWSRDEKYLAFLQVDESPVKEESRVEILADNVKVKKQRYPTTGTKNVKLKLGVLRVSNPKNITWVKLAETDDIYVPRVQWHKDKSRLYFQVQSRDQKSLKLISYDLKTKKRTEVLEETSEAWVSIQGNAFFLKGRDQFVWSSERTGFEHLYLYSGEGELLKTLTSGDWELDRLSGFNEKENNLYFTGKKTSPLENHLYKLNIDDPSSVEKVTQREGFHWISMAKSGAYYVDSFSAPMTPMQTSLHKASGERVIWLEENKVEGDHPLAKFMAELQTEEFHSFKSSNGDTIHYKLLKPKGFDKSKKYPLLVSVYGGPGLQMVRKSWGWGSGLTNQLMAQQGFVVLSVDNRGTPGRGRRFEDAIYGRLANVEVQDQKEALEHVLAKGFIDREKVAVTGHSYGGYMTLMLMAKHPELYKVGVAGAPVTDFSLYDTHYTERYLGTPQGNPEGYKASNVLEIADQIKGKLLVIHGMADDNVLFKNSTMLFKKLQDAGIQFEMMTYPGAKHGLWGKSTRLHYNTAKLNFLLRHLE